jgi:hypothetical protein
MRSIIDWCRLLVAVAVTLVALPFAATSAAADVGINTPSRLTIMAIRCNDQNDVGGDDEIYITIDGLGRVWERSGIDEEQWVAVDRWFDFEGQLSVHIMEDDGGWTGEDDHLGVWHVPDTVRGQFQSSFWHFSGYTMWIDVRDP